MSVFNFWLNDNGHKPGSQNTNGHKTIFEVLRLHLLSVFSDLFDALFGIPGILKLANEDDLSRVIGIMRADVRYSWIPLL